MSKNSDNEDDDRSIEVMSWAGRLAKLRHMQNTRRSARLAKGAGSDDGIGGGMRLSGDAGAVMSRRHLLATGKPTRASDPGSL